MCALRLAGQFKNLKGQLALRDAAVAVTEANSHFGHKFPHNTLDTWLKFYEKLSEFQIKTLMDAHGTQTFSTKVKLSDAHDVRVFLA